MRPKETAIAELARSPLAQESVLVLTREGSEFGAEEEDLAASNAWSLRRGRGDVLYPNRASASRPVLGR